MKKFTKKLSFVMATAMVVSSLYAPQSAEAKKSKASKIVVKGSGKKVKSKNIYLAGQTVDFDAIVKGKNTNSGKWKSSNKKVARVSKKGVVKVVGEGKAKITFTAKKKKGQKKATKLTVTVNGRVRASKMSVSPASITVKMGDSQTLDVTYSLSKKVKKAGGKATTYKLFAESTDPAVSVSTDGNNKVTVKGVSKSATPVAVKLYAAQTSSLEAAKKVKIKTTAEVKVKVTGMLEAKQTGANRITVKGTGLIASPAAYVIKDKDGRQLNLDLKKFNLNKEGTEIVLYGATTALPEGMYTLKYGDNEPVELKIEKSEMKEIKITSLNAAGKEVAIPVLNTTNNKYDKAVAYYEVRNQFGEDVTKSYAASNLNISGMDNAHSDEPGTIEFDNNAGYNRGFSKLTVSIVDLAGKVPPLMKTLEIGEDAYVSEAKFVGIYDMRKREIVKSRTISAKEEVSAVKNNLKLVFTTVDNYGKSLDQDYKYLKMGLGGDDSNIVKQLYVNLISPTANVILGKTAKVDKVNIDGEMVRCLVYDLDVSSNANELKPGEVSIFARTVRTGKSVEGEKFNVATTLVDDISVMAPVSGVYVGKKNEISYRLLDADKKEIKPEDITVKGLNRMIPNNGGYNLYFEKDTDGKIKLYLDLTHADKYIRTVFVSFLTQTNKFKMEQIAVRALRYPVSIVGFKEGTVLGVTSKGTKEHELKLNVNQITFADQYGNPMSVEDIVELNDGGITLKLEKVVGGDSKIFDAVTNSALSVKGITSGTGNFNTSSDTAKLVFSARAKSLNKTTEEKYKLTLTTPKGYKPNASKDIVSEYEFSFFNVNLADMSDFKLDLGGVHEANGFSTGNVAKTDKQFYAKVTGKYAGYNIVLVNGDDYLIRGEADKDFVSGINNRLIVPADKDDKLKEKNVTAVINDGKGTTVTEKLRYNSQAAVATKAEYKGGEIEKDTGSIAWNQLRGQFTIKDQYGVVMSGVTPYVTFSDLKKGDVVTLNGRQLSKYTPAADTKDVVVKLVVGEKTIFEGTVKIKVTGAGGSVPGTVTPVLTLTAKSNLAVTKGAVIALKDLIASATLGSDTVNVDDLALSLVTTSAAVDYENGADNKKIKIKEFTGGNVTFKVKAEKDGKSSTVDVTVKEKLGTIALINSSNTTIVTGAAGKITSGNAIDLKNVFTLLKVTDANGNTVATNVAVASATAVATAEGITVSGSSSTVTSPEAITCTSGAVNAFKVALNEKAGNLEVKEFQFKVEIKIDGYEPKKFTVTVKARN